MSKFQTNLGPIGIETPLGKDKVLLTSFSGEEHMSGLFRFDLRLMSEEGGIKPADIVGKPVDFYVRYPDDTPRYFNGIVSRLVYSGRSDRSFLYEAEIVPWLWLLTKGSDCRVHETEKSQDAKDIIDGLLGRLQFSDYEWDVKRTLEKREYCVQFRETHYDFLTRLLQEEGIFYYFRHEQGKHTLVMTDHVDGVIDCRDTEVQLLSNLSQPELTDNLTGWNHTWELTSGKYAHTDYNFETPSTSLLLDKKSLVSLNGNSKLEYYDFPGVYADKGLGDSLAQLRIEGEEVRYNTVTGGSACRSFSPGGRFKVARHHDPGEAGGQWTLLSVRHEATLGGSYVTTSSHPDFIYQNSFRCIPSDIVYRPPYRHRAGIHGVQSAIVVGPSGEEIFTDKYGRVKVQFYWDRLGRKDDHSSAWIRVSQVHAGSGWGMMDLPRIGEEVIVSFMDGNPDRPIIMGRVYNGNNPPPFSLPGEKTRRGNTTKSHKAGGYNEISMDDTAGKEQLRINAQYNMNSNVNNDQTLDVGKNQTENVGVNRQRTVGSNETVIIGANKTASIGANDTQNVAANQSLTVGLMKTEAIGTVFNELVGVAKTSSIGSTFLQTVGEAMNTGVGLVSFEEVGIDKAIVVGNEFSVSSGGDFSLHSDAKMAIDAGNTLDIKSGDAMTADAGTTMKLSAKDKITISCGSSSIEMESSGKITIAGTDVTMKAGAGKVNIDPGGIITIKGPMVKINT